MRRILRVVPFIILTIALVLLYFELRHLRLEELSRTLLDYSWRTFAAASLLLFVNYFVWSGYDWTSLRQLRIHIPYVQIFRTTSVAFPITNLVGYSLITGFATRLKHYEPAGVSYTNITKLILFNITTWWIGFLALCGLGLVLSPNGDLFKMSDSGARAIGVVLLLTVAVYLYIAWRTKGREFFYGKFHMHFPSVRSGVIKIAVSVADNIIVGLTLFVFLPSAQEVSFFHFMVYFLSAYLIAMLSFVPAGWGVLEGVLLILFRPYAPDAEILASMVLFRVFHYLIPVALAIIYVGFRRVRAWYLARDTEQPMVAAREIVRP